jgi:UPF0716 protein FxsA
MRLVLLIAFLVVPLTELAVIVQVQRLVGLDVTILALLGISIAGAWLVKREGLRAWVRFRGALQSGRLPAVEVVDGALLLFAGALLLTPGFLTDAVGLACLMPPTRALINRALRGRVRRSLGLGAPVGRPRQRGPSAADATVDVEIVDVRREPREGTPPEAIEPGDDGRPAPP